MEKNCREGKREAMTNKEINEACARKLGLALGKDADTLGKVFESGIDEWRMLPNYSTDIKAAWEIVDYLQEKEFIVKVTAWPMETRKAYSCHIKELAVNHPGWFSEDYTAPMSICLAFLKLS